MSFNGEIDRI
jgi:hypothetical protein